MISEELLSIMADSYAAMNDRNEWSRILLAFARTFEHRWVNERIIHPLPIVESRARRKILNQSHRFMAWHYHMIVLGGGYAATQLCAACRNGYSGHNGWQDPFHS
jgi:hypothetical protein